MTTIEEYRQATEHGKQCEARLNGILRGGYSYNGCFYTMAGMTPTKAPLEMCYNFRHVNRCTR